jgi:axial budding pattern protein 2
MPWMRGKWALLVSAIVLPGIANALPEIQFPINSQVPPVARASRPYTFTFAESTFTSTAGPITYALFDQPAWLRLDSGTRTFRGSPEPTDTGSVIFRVLATDVQGATALTVTLVVVQNEVLEVGQSILSQLGGFGIPSSPSSLLFYPSQSFAFRFSPDTFLRTSSSTIYYAVSEDNSPLPSWLEFDASVLGFSGTTPPLVSPTATPQIYGVKMVASDVPGFLEASTAFEIVVGYHILAFPVAIENINASSGREVATSPLRQTLRLDGNPARSTDLISISANAPSWLMLNREDISLSGTPPADATGLSVTISVMDVFGDVANATINFAFKSNSTHLFLDDLPAANATIGKSFNYTIRRSSLAPGNVTMMADLGIASAWLAFNPGTLSLNGHVPQDLSPGQLEIALHATSEYKTDQKILRINVIRGPAATSESHTTTVTPSSKSSSSITASASRSPSTRNHLPLSRSAQLKIVLAAVLSTVILLFLLTLFICCRHLKKKVQDESAAGISDPISAPEAAERVEPELEDAGILDPAQSEEIQRHVTPNEPPRIELSWAPDSLPKAKARLSRRISAKDESLLDLSFAGSLHEGSESTAHKRRGGNDASQQFERRAQDLTPFVSIRTSSYSRKRTPLQPTQSGSEEKAAPKRASRTLSAISAVTFGLSHRLSGAGHGAGGTGPSELNDIRSSWQDIESSLPSLNSRATALNIVEEFPQPPVEAAGGGSIRSPQRNGKASVRLVETTCCQIDSPIDEEQRLHTKRARDPLERAARFSHARSSRPRSGGRRLEADNSTLGNHDQLTRHNTHCGRCSECPCAGTPIRPDITTRGRDPGRAFIRPSSKLICDRSTASSGQFDSALSTSSSQWEDEILTTEVDFQVEENQDLADSAGREDQRITPHNAPLRRSATAATLFSEASSAGELHISPPSRKLRLGEFPGQRPVSLGKGNLQKSQRSHQGSLAFV